MEHRTFTQVVSYKDESITLDNLSGYCCKYCQEVILDNASYDRYIVAQKAVIDEYNRQSTLDYLVADEAIDYAIKHPEEIKTAREVKQDLGIE
jgi:YgiT-type zinc finger domain-containing protein